MSKKSCGCVCKTFFKSIGAKLRKVADLSGIEWTDATWNPLTGCTKISPGCKNCYAERLVLTKRAERLAKLAPDLPWPPHIWQGVSVENQFYTKRVGYLQKVPAAVRFLSVEPLLGPIKNVSLEGIQWVIVCGESDRLRGRC
jgi:protein gp37